MNRFREILERKPFRPHPLVRGGHLQTILGSIWPRDFSWGWSQSHEEFLDLEDGTRIRLLVVEKEREAPTLIAIHGLGGSSDSTYMRGLSHKAWKQGWNSVLVNLYDCNLQTSPPRIFHAGSSDRLGGLVRKLSSRYSPLFLAGISLGGNILLKLLGEWEEQARPSIGGAVAISPLLDLTISWSTLDRPANRFFRNHYLRGLRRIIRAKEACLRDHVDLQALTRVRHIRDFDELFTAPLGGFRDAMDYYVQASSAPLLGKIRVPTLLLHAEDDPMLPADPLFSPGCHDNPFLTVGITESGGHVGFVQAEPELDRAWAEHRGIEFLAAVVG